MPLKALFLVLKAMLDIKHNELKALMKQNIVLFIPPAFMPKGI